MQDRHPRVLTPVACTLLVLGGLSMAFPDPAATQTEDPDVLIPDGPGNAGQEVREALVKHYAFGQWRNPRYHNPPRFTGDLSAVCHADAGHLCYPEPWGGCFAHSGRCRTQAERVELVLEFRDLARRYPDSPFAFAHGVYAAIRHGLYGVAEELVESCTPEGAWWCNLATGHLLHRMGHSSESEAFLRRALLGMPEGLRRKLEDVSPLLRGAGQHWYEDLPSEERRQFHGYFWWLADPLYSEEGNDRRLEHLVRRFEKVLGDSLCESLAGYICELSFLDEGDWVARGIRDSFEWGKRSSASYPTVTFTSKKAAFNHFVPDVLSLEGLDETLTYRLEASLEDEGYTRASGPVVQLPSQMARFREGDSLIVAMATDLEAAGVFSETDDAAPGRGAEILSAGQEPATDQVRFFTSQGPDHIAFFEAAPLRDRAVLAGRIANRIQLIGVEVSLPGTSARDRRVLVPLEAAEPLLSDLLLFRPQGPGLPHTRMGAVALMHGSQEVPRDQELGVYWEGYGFPAVDSVAISLQLKGEEGGWLSGLGRVVGLVGEVHEGALTWREPIEEGVLFARAIGLNVSGLGEGEYELVLSMEMLDGDLVTRSRTFRVVEGGGR